LRVCPDARSPSPAKLASAATGRAERRTLKVTAVARGLAFPPQAGREEEAVRRELLRHHVADRLPGQPAQLAASLRGHWAIEDWLHWVRDMDFEEDRPPRTIMNC
jgi:hypothetical protein